MTSNGGFYSKEFDRLVGILKLANIVVNIEGKAEDGIVEDTITINKNHKPEYKLYYLMHEVGHWMMFANREKYDTVLEALEKSERTLTYKVSKIEEEITAWNLGKRFAENLNISFNDEIYEKLKGKCVTTYIRSLYAL